MVQTTAKMTYTFTNDKTGETLAVANQHQTVTIMYQNPQQLDVMLAEALQTLFLNIFLEKMLNIKLLLSTHSLKQELNSKK